MLAAGQITNEEAEALRRIYHELEPVRSGQVPGTIFNVPFWAAVETTFGTSRGAALRPMIQQTLMEHNEERRKQTLKQQQQGGGCTGPVRKSKILTCVQTMLVAGQITNEEADALQRIYHELEPVRNGGVPGTIFNVAFWAAVETTFGTSRGAALRPMIQQTLMEHNEERRKQTLKQQQQGGGCTGPVRKSKILTCVQTMLVAGQITNEEADALQRIYHELEPVRNGGVPGTIFNVAFWAAVETTFGTSREAALRPMIQQTIMQPQQQPVALMGVNVPRGHGGLGVAEEGQPDEPVLVCGPVQEVIRRNYERSNEVLKASGAVAAAAAADDGSENPKDVSPSTEGERLHVKSFRTLTFLCIFQHSFSRILYHDNLLTLRRCDV